MMTPSMRRLVVSGAIALGWIGLCGTIIPAEAIGPPDSGAPVESVGMPARGSAVAVSPWQDALAPKRVAEPSTLVLVALGSFALVAWNRRRR